MIAGIFLLVVSVVILIMLLVVSFQLRATRISSSQSPNGSAVQGSLDSINDCQNWVFASIIITIILMLSSIYLSVKGTAWESHLIEWLNIVVRLLHITFGIAWIGASFYFVFLENALNRTKDVRPELAGNLWAIHGGGFYYLEKYKVAPSVVPKDLHWFKYEAYFTWISGFCLLFIVYYFNASAMLVDKNLMDISGTWGIVIGIGSFIISWVVYDLMCKSGLFKNNFLFIIAGCIFAAVVAYGYTMVFVNRAAYLHFGAMLGTLMAANVFFVIIPAQKAMVRAALKGIPVNPKLGINAGRRSLHNNYLTLPVLFVMISNHFPVTFGHKYSWLILMLITFGTAGVKHYLNLKEKGRISVWVLPVSILILLGAAFITAPAKNPGACSSIPETGEVYAIIQSRCASCHSSRPTDDFYKAPPNGVVYDTQEDIIQLKEKILQRAVISKTMPLNNKTNMTEKERDMVRCWIENTSK